MATLTETAYHTRRTINWLILGFIAYLTLRLLWGILAGILLRIFPPKPPPPTHAFGMLPKLVFPQQASPSAALTFRLETIEGSVPKASESAAVYFMPKKPANLLALTRTQSFAKRLGFDGPPIPESKNIYRFDDLEVSLRKLRYDIVSDNFILRYNFEQDPGLFTEHNLPSPETAISEVKNMLQTYDIYPSDIAGGKTTATFLKLMGNKLSPTTSLSQADVLRVDLFRQMIGNTRIVTPLPDEGPVVFLFSGSSNPKKHIIQFAYTLWPIDYETSATYAIKPSSQAWQELQSGLGFIARYPQTGTTAVIRTATLAYYDSFTPQTYLQPVFVFEGDDGFLAFVPAVDATWVEK